MGAKRALFFKRVVYSGEGAIFAEGGSREGALFPKRAVFFQKVVTKRVLARTHTHTHTYM